MKQMIADFNAAHAGKVKIDATTLEWGTPFYAKVQTSAAVGEAPDIMTYHASRIPLAVTQGILEEITADDMSQDGPVEFRLCAGDLGRSERSTASNMRCRSIPIRSCSTTTATC